MNIMQQADHVIATSLKSDDYAVALRFVEACHVMSSRYGTPVEDVIRAANMKLAARVSNRSSSDD
jgi:hypothetical protein